MKLVFSGLITVFMSYLIYNLRIYDYLLETFSTAQGNDISLLVINITEAEHNPDKVARDLVTDFKTIGFAAVHGVKDFDPDELLKWSKWFFDLPLGNKMAIAKQSFNKTSPAVYRGYYPIVPGTHSFKEAYEMGTFNQKDISRKTPTPRDLRNSTTNEDGRLYMRNILEEKNIFPITNNEENDVMFMKVMIKYNKIFQHVGNTIFKLLLIGHGLEPIDFPHFFCNKSLSTFRLLHYPSRLNNPSSIPADAWDGNQALVTGAHFDSSLLTLLATFDYQGIQIRPPGFSKWVDLPADKNKLLINIGALMSYMFDGILIATDHRVLDIGDDRYSLPLFLEGCFDSDLSKTFSGRDNNFVEEFTRYGPWMANRTSQFYEYATTDFGVVN